MKPSLKTVVKILESSIVKTDDVTNGRRDVDPHGRLRAVQGANGTVENFTSQSCIDGAEIKPKV